MYPKFCLCCRKYFFCEIIYNRHQSFRSTISQNDNSVKLCDGESQADFDLSENEDDFKSIYKFGFWNLEMCDQMKKWSGNKFKKTVVQVFFNLTLISRALSRDKFLKKIMKKGRKFQKELKVYDYSEHDVLLAAVPYYRYKLRTKILHPKTTLRGGEPSNRFNLWDFINDVLAGERGDTWDYPKKVSPGFLGVRLECLEVLPSLGIT